MLLDQNYESISDLRTTAMILHSDIDEIMLLGDTVVITTVHPDLDHPNAIRSKTIEELRLLLPNPVRIGLTPLAL